MNVRKTNSNQTKNLKYHLILENRVEKHKGNKNLSSNSWSRWNKDFHWPNNPRINKNPPLKLHQEKCIATYSLSMLKNTAPNYHLTFILIRIWSIKQDKSSHQPQDLNQVVCHREAMNSLKVTFFCCWIRNIVIRLEPSRISTRVPSEKVITASSRTGKAEFVLEINVC